MHQNRRLALSTQTAQHPQGPRHLPGQHRLTELEDVVASNVQDGSLNLLEAQLSRRKKQPQLLHLLVCGEQVAFDSVCKECKRALARLAAPDPLALRTQALCDPHRQCRALDGIDAHGDACGIERLEPAALLLLSIQARQLDQRDDVVTERLAVALQRLGPVLARLAGRNADLDQLLVGKQTHRLGRPQQAAPVEVSARHGVHRSFGVPCMPGRKTQLIACFLREEWLVAPDGVERADALLEMTPELIDAQLHGLSPRQCARSCSWGGQGEGSAASRRMTCSTSSFCSSRKMRSSSDSLASAVDSV